MIYQLVIRFNRSTAQCSNSICALVDEMNFWKQNKTIGNLSIDFYLPIDFRGLSSVSTLLRFSNLYPDDLDWDLDSRWRLRERGIYKINMQRLKHGTNREISFAFRLIDKWIFFPTIIHFHLVNIFYHKSSLLTHFTR